MAFSAKTLDFLFENRLNDSKEWFNEHKSDYQDHVMGPFKDFTAQMLPHILDIDDQISNVRISRIYRDARFAKGKSVFRENMWCVFGRARDLYKSLPCFYFEISPNGYEYGCGYYTASSESLEALRELILSDSPYFKAADEAYRSQNTFELYGEMYKRNRYPEESEEKCLWLNRKSMGLSASSQDWELLFSDKLTRKIAEEYNNIAPIYAFFMKAEELAAQKRQPLSK